MRLFLLTKPAQKPVSLFCTDIGTLYSKIYTKRAGENKKQAVKTSIIERWRQSQPPNGVQPQWNGVKTHSTFEVICVWQKGGKQSTARVGLGC